MPTRTMKRRWFLVVAFLRAAALSIAIGFLVGYALGRLHREEGPPKPLPVGGERPGPAETRVTKGTRTARNIWGNLT